MVNREISICREYSEAIFRRGKEPMEPFGFQPNWIDQPSRHKIYQQVERLPLPTPAQSGLRSIGEIMGRLQKPQSQARAISYEELATILQFAHGTLNRRLDVHWNQNDSDRALYAHATYGRGTASGGGMYPTEIYWVCGQSSPLLPGIYHYDNGHHAMARLVTGDMTQRIRTAVFEHPAALATDQFLLISLNFWKNSFKYNSFSYHVVTQDLGALLASLRLLATGFGSDLSFLFWYADEDINRLLGLETLEESVFVVLPIPIAKKPDHPQMPPSIALASDVRLTSAKKASFQRSHEILRFETIERVHRSALLQQESLPASRLAYQAACDEFPTRGEKILLPAPAAELLKMDILDVFRQRRSSFGRFSCHVPLRLEQFATMLSFAAASGNYSSDLKPSDGGQPHFTRLMAFIHNVEGVTPGAYAYDGERHCLWTVSQQDYAAFLQENYFLQNYNLAEIAALLVIVGKPAEMLKLYGNRGYRMLQAEVGLVAQSLYMASTALSFRCGAALGFDNIALNKALELGEEERSFLFLLIGNGLDDNADFSYPLV